MRFKFDENLPIVVSAVFLEAGYDSRTVLQQKMGGIQDAALMAVCRDEQL